MEEFFFVVNPASGNGTTVKKWQQVMEFLNQKGVKYQYMLTTKTKHATAITREAIKKGYKNIIAVGGDGTINEVVNGFFDKQGKMLIDDAMLGIISRGTGCDLIKTLGIPKEYDRSVEKLIEGKNKKIDLVKVVYLDKKSGSKKWRYCVNTSDVGLGGYVICRINNTAKSGGGFWAYLKATFFSVVKYNNKNIKISVDGKNIFSGRFTIAAIANGKYLGGGMNIAPKAKIDDGIIDVVLLEDVGKVELLFNLIKVYKGTHLEHPKVKYFRGCEVILDSTEPLPMEVDGEYLNCEFVKYSIEKKKLSVLC